MSTLILLINSVCRLGSEEGLEVKIYYLYSANNILKTSNNMLNHNQENIVDILL
jgi:hypothetical protein